MSAERMPMIYEDGHTEVFVRGSIADQGERVARPDEQPGVQFERMGLPEMPAEEPLSETIRQVEARVSQDSAVVQEIHKRGMASAEAERDLAIARATAVYDAREEKLRVARERADKQLDEMGAVLETFAVLCNDRRANLGEAIQYEDQEKTQYQQAIDATQTDRAELRSNRNELQRQAGDMEALIATTELVIVARTKETERLSEKYADIKDAAAERNRKMHQARAQAQDAAVERVAQQDNEDIDALYLGLEQQGAYGSYGQDHVYTDEDRRDMRVMDDIVAKVGRLTKSIATYKDNLEEYKQNHVSLNKDIATHISTLQRLSARHKNLSVQAKEHEQALSYLTGESATLDAIARLELTAVEGVTDFLREPYDAAEELIKLLQKNVVAKPDETPGEIIAPEVQAEAASPREQFAKELKNRADEDAEVIQLATGRTRT